MAESNFRSLVAYQAARSLARNAHASVRHWGKFDQWTVGVQLVRAADSIGANIAKAMGRFHLADQRRLLLFARGSLYETEHWIQCAAERGLLDAGEFEAALSEAARTLSGLITKRHAA
ncbi:MAG TPA: four helix bundle protein [Solirubrobacterales bacterium]|nr:four helix bundle protein [Solirubrobacterales bacterium]